MVTASELADDVDYEDIRADVELELRTYGPLTSMAIPREGADAGSILVQYDDAQHAGVAAAALAGRLFAGRKITADFE